MDLTNVLSFLTLLSPTYHIRRNSPLKQKSVARAIGDGFDPVAHLSGTLQLLTALRLLVMTFGEIALDIHPRDGAISIRAEPANHRGVAAMRSTAQRGHSFGSNRQKLPPSAVQGEIPEAEPGAPAVSGGHAATQEGHYRL